MKKTFMKCLMAFVAMFAVALVAGCGGGGGGGAAAPAPTVSANKGLVRANVSFTDSTARKAYLAARTASRTAEQDSSQIVVIEIAITGYYSGDGEEFDPITATLEIDLATGYGTVSVTEVPVGFNHILTAVATWPDGSTDTIMGLIYEVAPGATTDATADEASTVLVQAALAYAEANGVPLSDVDYSVIVAMEDTIEQLAAQGISYSEMNVDSITAFLEVAEMEITPATATVELGGQQVFTADLYDPDGVEVTDVLVSWSVDSTLGEIDSAGVFTASGVGSGVVTAVAGDLIATASVTVTSACLTDADCDDSNPDTIDSCVNAGTDAASCSNAPISCSSDTECDDGSELTVDSCLDPGTDIAICENTPVACATDLDCSAPATVCVDGGTLTAMCVDCLTDAECATTPMNTCVDGGTASALCIECLDDTDCTAPTGVCMDGGLATSVCVECMEDIDCDDADLITWDVCQDAGTTASYCENLSPEYISDISIGETILKIEISGDESTVYVTPAPADRSTATIYIIDTATAILYDSVDLPDGFDAIALDNTRNQMYLNYYGEIVAVDLSTETEVQYAWMSSSPYYDMVVAQNADKLILNTLYDNHSIDVIDLSNFASAEVSIPSSLYYYSHFNQQMAVDEANSKVIVPGADGEIGIIDLSSMTESQVLASTLFTVDYMAQAVVGKNTDTAYVLSEGSAVMVSIDTVNEVITNESVVSSYGYGRGGLGIVEDPGHLFIDMQAFQTVFVNATSTLQTVCGINIPSMSNYGSPINFVTDHTNRQVFVADSDAGVVHVIRYVANGTSCVACDPADTADGACCNGEVDGGLGTDCYLSYQGAGGGDQVVY